MLQKTSPLNGLRICYLGHFDPYYSRNRIIIKALTRAGAEVIQIVDRKRFFRRWPFLIKKALPYRFDIIFVGFPGHSDVPVAKLIGRKNKAPVIFDAFVSLFDSNVWDRRITDQRSPRAHAYFLMDQLSCKLADIILLDTETHISYFSESFHIPRSKFRRVWLGADDDVMYPRKTRKTNNFTVFFYGHFIPLHGIEHILNAAKILELRNEAVNFVIVGRGQTYSNIQSETKRLNLKHIEFLGNQPYNQLPVLMSESSLCLGIFGTTPKAQRVIPNKVFDALAVRKPLITADTPSVRECLVHGQHVWLCPAGDPQELAESIILLKQNNKLRDHLAGNGYSHFKQFFSIDAVAKELVVLVEEILN